MKKKTISIIAIFLAIALLVTLLFIYSQGFKNWNAYCWFGHDYGEDGTCTRCGKDLATTATKSEPDIIQTTAYRTPKYNSVNAVAASNYINNPTSWGNPDEYSPSNTDKYLAKNPTTDDTQVCIYFDKEYSFNHTDVLTLNNGSNFWIYYKTEGYQLDPDASYPTPCSFIVFYRNLTANSGWRASYVGNSDDLANALANITTKGAYEFFIAEEHNQEPYSRTNVFRVDFVDTELPPEPVKQGYTFTGWYTDEACTQLYTEDMVVGDITLYAGFRANTYTLNFVAQGGTGNMTEMQCTYGVEYTLPACTFERPNYKFVGWCIDNDDTATQTVDLTDGQKFSNLSAEDGYGIDLFAMWELNEVTVSFEWDDNVLEVGCIIGQKVVLPDEPSKTGYIFVGWQYDDGTMYDGQAITEDTTLTAKFEIIKCTVTFIVDGEVYCVYVCDYGTKLSDALRKSDVNTALYETEDEYSRNF